MQMLNFEVLRRAARLSPMQFANILAAASLGTSRAGFAADEERPDVMLRGLTPAVGSVGVRPRYVGDVRVDPRYPGGGRVGAPAAFEAGPDAQRPIGYSNQQYVAGDVSWFGLGSKVIPAGSVGTDFEIKPPRPFAPQQLFCPSTVQGLLVKAASIGGTNILCGTSGLPIELLSEVSQVPMIEWPTINESSGIVLTISNPTGGDLTFSGAFYGTQVRI